MADYELYGADGVTPIVVRRPNGATWTSKIRGERPNGVEVESLSATASWIYDEIDDYWLQVIHNARLSGVQNFKTFREPGVGSPGGYVKCSGIIAAVIRGTKVDNNWVGVRVVFRRVKVV